MLRRGRRARNPGVREPTLSAAWLVDRDHFQDGPAPPTSGNLFEPMPQWTAVSALLGAAPHPNTGRAPCASQELESAIRSQLHA